MNARLLLCCASLLLAGAFAGCEGVPTRITERFTPVPAQTRPVDGAYKDVFFAAQVALKKIDFTLSRTAQAQGIVDGHSRVMPGSSFGDNRQYTIEVRIREMGPLSTDVSVLVHRQQEGDFKAGATNEALRDHGLYDSFFAALSQSLREAAAAPATSG